jgi:tRNA pseudouridine38-40 synthase
MQYFIGKHNFRNFSKRNEKNPNREIKNIEVEVKDNILIFTITGQSFLWNMVRKMVTSLLLVGYGELEVDTINKLLQPVELRQYIRLRPAPANGLILSDMEYKNIKFKDSQYAKDKLIEVLKKEYIKHDQEKKADIKLIELLEKQE